jgi:hypothetical protein
VIQVFFKNRKVKNIHFIEEIGADPQREKIYEKIAISSRLQDNLAYLRVVFQSADIVFYEFTIFDGRNASIVYIEGLSDSKHIGSDILFPLTKAKMPEVSSSVRNLPIEKLVREYTTIAETRIAYSLSDVITYVMREYVLLFIDGEATGAALSAVSRRDRAIEQPDTETVIRGPREGFNENIATSISLIRRRLPTPGLHVESFRIGSYTKTDTAICYIDGIIDPNLVHEARSRLERIKIDGIIDTGYIEELIEDNPFSPFPQLQNTERPDVVTAALLEGKFALLTDGSPFALIAPVNAWSALQASEDNYERYLIATLVRWLRYLYMFFALYLPSMYVAITTFHQEMLPTRLLLSVAAAREVTPLPAVAEALLMEITFEILREAGIRLPKAIGSAISIVGALVIGQAAVQAGMVSAPMVIVVSITGIASFAIPRYSFAIALRMLRFPMIFFAGTLGLFGILIGSLAIVIHLCCLRSFGKPYLEPVSPLIWQGLKDVIVRAPRWAMKYRPLDDSKYNPERIGGATKPGRRSPKHV